MASYDLVFGSIFSEGNDDDGRVSTGMRNDIQVMGNGWLLHGVHNGADELSYTPVVFYF